MKYNRKSITDFAGALYDDKYDILTCDTNLSRKVGLRINISNIVKVRTITWQTCESKLENAER